MISTTTVRNQKELDAALAGGATYTCIRIESERGVWLRLSSSGSATVQAYGSATVQAYGSATVRAYDTATVEASGSATVEAYDTATVRAYDTATVRAYDTATVQASGSATVEAYDTATVQAYDTATVQAYGTATVEAYGSATVQAYDTATVEAYDTATVQAYDTATVQASGSATVRAYDTATVQAYDTATVQAYGAASVHAHARAAVTATSHVAVHLHSARARVDGGVIIDLTTLDLHAPDTWCHHHGVTVTDDGRAVLYKAVPDDLTTGHGYGHEYTWSPSTELVCADWADDHTCGGGLHLSPTPAQATYYRNSATRWMRVTAALDDVRPIPGVGSAKCKVRACRVEAEVDMFGRELATAGGEQK